MATLARSICVLGGHPDMDPSTGMRLGPEPFTSYSWGSWESLEGIAKQRISLQHEQEDWENQGTDSDCPQQPTLQLWASEDHNPEPEDTPQPPGGHGVAGAEAAAALPIDDPLLSLQSRSVHSLPALPRMLDGLCRGLDHAFHAEKKQLLGSSSSRAVIDFNQPAESFGRLDQSVRRLMAEYTAHGSQDWQQFMAFNPHHYVRHLIDATDDYELILICWGQGQVSRVHNHGTSHCWLTCLKGEVEEKQYALPPPPGPGATGVLEPCPELLETDTLTLNTGATGYINDHVCLHSVGCGPSVGEAGAVTLHLYAPPIRRVQLYEPEEDRVVVRVPGYCTVRGQHTSWSKAMANGGGGEKDWMASWDPCI